eukprot:6489155-Amphidinium_carterae.2
MAKLTKVASLNQCDILVARGLLFTACDREREKALQSDPSHEWRHKCALLLAGNLPSICVGFLSGRSDATMEDSAAATLAQQPTGEWSSEMERVFTYEAAEIAAPVDAVHLQMAPRGHTEIVRRPSHPEP